MTTTECNESNEYFYRFRSIENLLGVRQELEKQAIYFASQDQLNDPLEGHINVYWQGDAITWRNLFKHYLNCVIFTFNLWKRCNECGKTLTWEDIPARDPLVAGIYPEHHELVTIFFNNPCVDLLIKRIINSERKIGRNELAAHLRAIHNFVIITIHSIYRRRNNPLYIESSVESMHLTRELDRIKSEVEIFDIAERKSCGDAEAIEKYYIDVVKEYEDHDLLNYYTDVIKLSDANRVFIFNDFCWAYIRRLGTLIYPPWYAACFMGDSTAASMWAYYGESHAGVCLKFKAEHGPNGRFINLNTITRYNESGSTRSMRPHPFTPVLYQSHHEATNFFETLGTITHPIANSQWYTNPEGEISRLLLRTEPERDIWLDLYWKRFQSINRTKTVSWESENEYRLVYYSMLSDLSHEDRTLTYDFSSLEGIIFGVRTPLDKKIAIAKVIEKKCRESARSNFKFYQANFLNNQSEMTFSELRLLSNTITA